MTAEEIKKITTKVINHYNRILSKVVEYNLNRKEGENHYDIGCDWTFLFPDRPTYTIWLHYWYGAKSPKCVGFDIHIDDRLKDNMKAADAGIKAFCKDVFCIPVEEVSTVSDEETNKTEE